MPREWSFEEINALADAMWLLLDDMGKDGKSVCLAAKACARVAFEPFRVDEPYDDWMSLAEAQAIIAEIEQPG
jgi:hypothetical protein